MVTVTQKWYMTLHHLKMHPHTKFGIPTSNNIGYNPDRIILEMRSVKVTVTPNKCPTLCNPKFEIPTSYALDKIILEMRSS